MLRFSRTIDNFVRAIMFFCFLATFSRVKTNPKNAINEHFLPRFLDFIVWGHEHECLVDPQVLVILKLLDFCTRSFNYLPFLWSRFQLKLPLLQEVPGMGFHITQPGSSVATSLIEGESKQKHVLLLEIKVVLHEFHVLLFFLCYSCFYIWVIVSTLLREINIVQQRYLWTQCVLLNILR